MGKKPGPAPTPKDELAARGSWRAKPTKRPRTPYVKSPWSDAQQDAVSCLFPDGDIAAKLLNHFVDLDEAWACWCDCRDRAMAYCEPGGRHPGHRPAAWWLWESPEYGGEFLPSESYADWLQRHGCMDPEEVAAYESSIWPNHYAKMRAFDAIQNRND